MTEGSSLSSHCSLRPAPRPLLLPMISAQLQLLFEWKMFTLGWSYYHFRELNVSHIRCWIQCRSGLQKNQRHHWRKIKVVKGDQKVINDNKMSLFQIHGTVKRHNIIQSNTTELNLPTWLSSFLITHLASHKSVTQIKAVLFICTEWWDMCTGCYCVTMGILTRVFQV